MGVFQFLSEHWLDIVNGLTAVIAGAAIIARVTPWEWDNQFLDKVQSIIHALALTKKPAA